MRTVLCYIILLETLCHMLATTTGHYNWCFFLLESTEIVDKYLQITTDILHMTIFQNKKSHGSHVHRSGLVRA